MQEKERPAKCTVILGATGTGKSFLVRSVIKDRQHVLVVTPDDIEWRDIPETKLLCPSDFEFDRQKRFVFERSSEKKDFVKLKRLNCFTNGILVFDDCRMYLSNKENYSEMYRHYFGRKRQKMVDYFFVAHGFMEVPPIIYTFATDLILFNTTDNCIRRKDVLKDYYAVSELQKRVTLKAYKNPHYCEHFKIS
jgi:hypothetical protein